MHGLQLIFVILLVAVVAVLSFKWADSRSRTLLERWADQQGYRVLEATRSIFGGPFLWTRAKGQTVYRVAVRLPDGATRRGYARVGSWYAGLLSDQVQVKWET